MRKFTSLAIFGLMWFVGSAAFADEHEYRNGICTMHDECDEHFERPVQDADGFYMLCNVGNVEWISQQVADNNIDLDCKLMNDIDFENVVNLHSPIGPSNGRKYNATFDGQGFRIKNMIIDRPDSEMQGFFGSLRGNPNNRNEGTVIKNLIIDKSCSITGALRTGGITGTGQNNAMEINIINCVNEASVTTTTKNAGGITGGSSSTHPIWKLTNCVNTGTITAMGNSADEKESAGISGWLGDNANTRVTNCFNLGIVDGIDASGRGVFRQSNSNVGINCYDLSFNELSTQYIDHDFTAEDILNGRVAYIINQKAGSLVFYQTLGEDEYPVPFNTSKVVYLQGELLCDGTPIEGGTYTNDPVEPVRPPHEYDEGDFHCINCGAISDDFCEKDAEGFYQLNNELDVCWFAEFVKAGNVEVNAKLNSDLDFTDYPDFAGIADRNNGFKGIFDGGFHTISNMDMSWRVDEDWVGFINFLNGGATVRNLRGDATCFICAHGNAGLIGGSTAPGDIYLENLGFEGDVSCTRAGAGGILGCNTGSQAHIYMTNCYSTGFISGSEVMENGALSAWLGSSGAVITNCWSSATVSGVQNDDKYLARFDNATFTNCYSVNGTPLQATIVDYDDVESGALCYKLNGNQDNIAWFQTLGEDEFPTFMPGHKQVYAVVEMRCDGWFDPANASYSNSSSTVKPDHKFADGFCSVCHQQDPNFPFLEVFANADHDTVEGYTTNNSGDGSGLAINNSVAEHWNMKWFETYQTIKGLEPGMYRLRVQGLTRAEAWSENPGAAYESGELSDAFAPLYHSSQYFAEVGGKRIASRFMDIAKEAQEERVGETENQSSNTGLWVPNSLAACNKYFGRGLYWNEPLYFVVENAEDSVNIGVENNMYLYGNWTVWDSWRLDKLTDGDIDLIRKQQVDAIQEELESLEPQASLMEAYNDAKDAIESATTLEEILTLSDVLSRTPNLIRSSHLAYEAYKQAIAALAEERAGRDDLYGAATDLLDKYLTEDEEADEELPNGTYLNIIDTRTLNEEELTAEIAFARYLFEQAIMSSINEGSDVSNIIKNAAFDEDGSFKDWETERTYESPSGSNFSSNTGFTDIYPVAGTWNTAFTVSQYIVADIPDGIYELEAPAFYRPGGNGTGDMEGNDYVPADLFINDFYTPVMNIYAGRVLYEDAINGVNCRYDASGDPDAPHNGESTSSQDFDTGDGYVPEQRQAVSFAFAGGRYINKVYGFVQGGELRIGIRNTGKPWYESGMTMWGKFKLTYRGYSEEAISAMMENYSKRLQALKYAREDQWIMYYSQSHIVNLDAYMDDVDAATTLEEKMAAIKRLNDEFNTILDSYDAYQELYNLYVYCTDKADENVESNPALSDAFAEVASEIEDHYMEGDLTDEEARNYRQRILNDPDLGGGFYVQGDLLDEEGGNLDYNTRSTVYPMTPQVDGTFVATVKVQNRANRANSDARAGIFISRMDERYECTSSSRRFITPANNTFKAVLDNNDAHQDFQTIGGEYKITFNPADSTIVFDLVSEYPWHNNVYVVGSIINVNGEQHRWKNDEMAPLAHKGNGVYEGVVSFFQDPNENLYPNFTIMSCRSNTGAIEHSTATRSGWNEGRYGSEENKLLLEDGVVVGDLIRGSDRKWYMNWDEQNTAETQEYRITFDMNQGTVMTRIMKGIDGDLNGDGKVDIADAVSILDIMAAGGFDAAADLNGDGKVDIADFVAVLDIMALQ
ncbi:MAG: dockerin type I repeat-containing protein [Bacteroidaceae bacterium]|nr:dockerin type I repeat-containing protein [Bacteroidaceae bacterium]